MSCEKTEKDSLVKGAVSLTVSVLIVKMIGFIYKVPLSYVLGDEGMGYFNSAYTIFTFFYMLSSGGVPRAVSILVSEFKAKEKYDALNKILIYSIRFFVLIGVVLTLLIFMLSGYISEMIGNRGAAFSLLLIAPSLTFVAATGVLRGYLNGCGKMLPIAISEVIEGSIKFILGLALALIGRRLGYKENIIAALAVLGVSAGSLVGMLFLSICTKKNKTKDKAEQKLSSDLSSSEIVRRILRISVPITLSAAIMGISNIIDLGTIMKRLIAAGYSESAAVSTYGNFTTLAIPMVNLISALTAPISSAALPHLTEAYTMRRIDEFESLIRNLISSISIIAAPAFFAYALFSNEILIFLFDDNSAFSAAPLLAALSPAVLILPLLAVMNTVLEATSNPRLSLISMSVGAVMKIISGYILMGKYGIIGAPISTVIAYALSMLISCVFVMKLSCRGENIANAILKPVLLSGGVLICARYAYVAACNNHYNVIAFIVIALLALVLYFLLLIIFMKNEFGKIVNSVKMNKKQEKTL